MKILITSDWYYPVVNGVVRSVLNLKEDLEKRGHEVRVLTLSNTLKSYKAENIYYVGSLSAKKIYPEARVSNLIAKTHLKEIKRWSPDVVHSQCEFSTFLMAKRITHDLKIPLIHTYHTIYEDYTHYFIPNKATGRKVVAVASKRFANLCDQIIAPSIKTKNLLVDYGIEDRKVSVIPTGIHIPPLYESNLRKLMGFEENTKILLYLGRLGAEKNIEEVIDFYQGLENEKARLYIVGGGPYQEDLKEFASKLDKKVEFVGMVDPSQVNKYYQVADVFITASTSETQGLTYYEALANGTVAICRKDSSLEGVIFDGFNGYQYDDFTSFNQAINKVLDNDELRSYLSTNARKYAVEKFSVESFGKKCEDLYEKSIKEYKYESINIFKRL